MNIDAVRSYLTELQARIVAALETIDGTRFQRDAWTRDEAASATASPLRGRGTGYVIEDGNIFERGGVNFSDVRGDRLPPSASVARPELAGRGFEALGVSLVLHPRNPYCPTVHLNVRCFATTPDAAGARHWWFGGGMDLTPYYGFDEDARHFHSTCKSALDPIDPALYPRFKAWCDRYFFLKHRNEPRGIGGVFFDDLVEGGFERCFAITRAIGDAFIAAYEPIIARRRSHAYAEREREFQLYRRGRYVEFNLVFDRGTLFGLQSGGRTESILMSMPPLARWRYNWHPEPGSAEAVLYSEFLRPRDWV